MSNPLLNEYEATMPPSIANKKAGGEGRDSQYMLQMMAATYR